MQITLEGRDFQVQLQGDADFVREAWRALRPMMKARTQEEKARQEQEDNPKPHILLRAKHPLYEKVYALTRQNLSQSPLGAFLDEKRLGSVYVDHPIESWHDLLGKQAFLWRHLSPAGQAKIGGTP